ncbi:hypothetical protein Tco_0978801 [Tanacetum coccineum]|uniref:Uncharacterized protein n=1 Tax=Tanacetum coccineum TaxID=301880 RepID=A0ABQ5EPA4_9ASTR
MLISDIRSTYEITILCSYYNDIRRKGFEYKGENFVAIGKDMHVFIGNMSHIIDFTILKSIEANMDPSLSQVVFGRPFMEIACLAINKKHRWMTFMDRSREVTIKTLYKDPERSELTSEGHDLFSSRIILSQDDYDRGCKRPSDLKSGFYKDVNKLGPEYRTGPDGSSSRSDVNNQGGSHSFGWVINFFVVFAMDIGACDGGAMELGTSSWGVLLALVGIEMVCSIFEANNLPRSEFIVTIFREINEIAFPLSLSFDFVFMPEIFKSLSFSLDRLCRLAILCLDQHAYTLYHLESLLTISLDRLDILKKDLVYQSLQKFLSLNLKLS